MISKVKYMPGYGVDIFSSDGGLLRQLGVVQAEVGWDPAPHPEKTTSVDKLCIDPGYLVWFPTIVNQISYSNKHKDAFAIRKSVF